MDATSTQSSFLGGEWSSHAQGRFDDPRYKTAMATCLNAIPLEEGSLARRPGSQFVATPRSGAQGRVIPFAFAANAPYGISLTDGHAQFVSGTRMLTRADNATVFSISTATPAVVTFTASKSWASSEQVVFTYGSAAVAQALPLLANRVFAATRLSSTSVSLADAVTGDAIDGSTLGWTSGLSLTCDPLLDLVTPWLADDLNAVRSVQTEAQSFMLHGSYQQRLLSATNLDGAGPVVFAITNADFLDGPYLDPPTDGSTLTPSGLSGTINLAASSLASINDGLGFTATDIGRSIRLLAQPSDWQAGGSYSQFDEVFYQGNDYICISVGGVSGITIAPTQDSSHWLIHTQGMAWAWAKIVAIIDPNVCTVTFQPSIKPDGAGATEGLGHGAAIKTWRLGLYSETTGWPKCGCYHEGRLWLSGAVKNRIDSSMSNESLIFSPTTMLGAVADNSAISYIFNDREVNDIFWLSSGLQGITCGTLGGEWLLQTGSANVPMTPTNIQAHRVTNYGCANIEPRHTGLTIVFVQKFKRKLMEYLADMFSGKFFGPNLAEYTKGITAPGIAELAYQDELAPIAWMRMSDGSLAGTTYKRTSLSSTTPPQFNGWHRHTLGSGRAVESICVGPSIDGALEALTVVTNDTAVDVRHIEVFRPIFGEGDALTDAWFLDDAVTPSAAVSIRHSNTDFVRLHGLWHLNGKTVSAFIGGIDCGDYTVASGFIDVPYGGQAIKATFGSTVMAQNTAFTAAYLVTLAGGDYGTMGVSLDATSTIFPCVVGFSYRTRGQMLRVVDPRDSGSRIGPSLGMTRRTHKYGALLQNTVQGAIKFGTSFSNLRLANLLTLGNSRYASNTLYSGLHVDVLEDGYSYESQLCWEIERPYPTTILAMQPFLQTPA